MKTYVFETTMTALSSISHNGGQSFGINSKLRREKYVQPDGSVEEIPVISGNSLRGMLRDRGMLHMCRALGYGVDDENGMVRGLTLPAFTFLFSGGGLSSDGGKALDLERARALRQLIPLAGIFGGGIGNMLLPGKLDMGKAIPCCAETSHLLPERFRRSANIWDYLQEEMYTRKDDSKNEHLNQAIDGAVLKRIEAARADKAAKMNEPQEDTGSHQQMMYYVETFAAGTPFYWKIVLKDVTDLEFEAFLTAMSEFSKHPYIGGKANVGMGEVSIACGNWFVIDSRMQAGPSATAITGTDGGYAAHLREHGAAIRESLRTMQ